ncbi:MAG: cytidine deaminase [Paramuribaculum sp.]|nr:cytidine deaminase [Paramuribaculum sp.]
MKRADITVPLQIAEYAELSAEDRALVDAARQATYRSYAPYSRFSVGAAILLSNGETVTGSNQENAAYPSGTCAERTAAYYAHSTYPDAAFKTIAIAARDTSGAFTRTPTAPCGACRQALLEYETLAATDVRVILAGDNEIFILPSVRSTLPLAFCEFA